MEGLTAWAEEAGGKVDVVAAPEEIPGGPVRSGGRGGPDDPTPRELGGAVVAAPAQEAGLEPIVKNTICSATRQLPGGRSRSGFGRGRYGGHRRRNSSEHHAAGRGVRAHLPRTFHIESADELDPAAFADCRRVGVTAGMAP